MKLFLHTKYLLLLLITAFMIGGCSTCKYSFKETGGPPPDVKTFRVNFFENRARYVNPQLAPQLTDKLRQKILGNTRLKQTNSDEAHYDISGYVSDYSPTTSGIANGNASTNRLNVTFHLMLKNTLDDTKNIEADVTSNFDFPATQSLAEAEASLGDKIIRNVVDAIFNKIFVNW